MADGGNITNLLSGTSPEAVHFAFGNLRNNAALLGALTTAQKFIELKGLPTAGWVKDREEMFNYLLAHMLPKGLALEFGVAAGDSIRYCAQRRPDMHFHGFDSFEGLPEAWHEHRPGTYSQSGVMPEVPGNVTLHKGWFEVTLPEFIERNKVELKRDGIRFLHLDADIYSATKFVLDQLGPYIRRGTAILFDEYWNHTTWEHDEFKAWQEFTAKNKHIVHCPIAYVPTKTQVAFRIQDTRRIKWPWEKLPNLG